MPTFVLLTRLSPEAVGTPAMLETLEREAMRRIRSECPGVGWDRFKTLVRELGRGTSPRAGRELTSIGVATTARP